MSNTATDRPEPSTLAQGVAVLVLVIAFCGVLLFSWGVTYAFLAPSHPALVGAKPQ